MPARLREVGKTATWYKTQDLQKQDSRKEVISYQLSVIGKKTEDRCALRQKTEDRRKESFSRTVPLPFLVLRLVSSSLVSFLQLEEAFGLLEKTFLHRGVLLADGFREGAEFFLLIGVEFGGDFDLDADVEVAAAAVAE